MPAHVIAARTVARRAATWRDTLAAGTAVVLAEALEDETARIVGFAGCGPQRDPTRTGFPGEIYGLYLLARVQRRGLGRALMGRMAESLLARGFHAASLWVVAGNHRAVSFYAALGGREVGRRAVAQPEGWSLDEIAFGWDDLTRLAQEPAAPAV